MLFPFVQFEYPYALGPADGRYLTRPEPGGEPDRVIVLRTLGAPQRRMLRGRRAKAMDGAEPEPVATARATLIQAEPFPDEAGAESWLDGVRGDATAREAEVGDALRRLNRLLRAQRAAAADLSVREVSAAGAIAIRVGYGSGDEVAEGRFGAAFELPQSDPGRGRKARRGALEPQERLAAILSRRGELLACEELVLRARADVAAGHRREAALQARIALEMLLAELGGDAVDGQGPLAPLREPVSRAANAALDGEPSPELAADVAEAVDRMAAALRRRHLESAG